MGVHIKVSEDWLNFEQKGAGANRPEFKLEPPTATPVIQGDPLIIRVYGEPAPQGSKSFKGMIRGKDGREHAVMAESSKKVKPWRQDVVDAARGALAARKLPIYDGSLIVRMIFTLRKPSGAPKRRRTWPNRKPDLSKLARSTEDALVTAGVIADDARIIEYERLAKVFPGEDPEALTSSGVLIVISSTN